MASTIRFTEPKELARGVNIFADRGGAVPTKIQDVYYVSDATLSLLREGGVRFEELDPVEYDILPLTEEMFQELQESVKQGRRGDVITVTDPVSLDDIIEQGRRKE